MTKAAGVSMKNKWTISVSVRKNRLQTLEGGLRRFYEWLSGVPGGLLGKKVYTPARTAMRNPYP